MKIVTLTLVGFLFLMGCKEIGGIWFLIEQPTVKYNETTLNLFGFNVKTANLDYLVYHTAENSMNSCQRARIEA